MGGSWKKPFGTEQSPKAIAGKKIQAARRRRAPELDLSELGLLQLPPSIGQLTQLQRLNVSRNQLTALPEVLGQLTQLKELDVSRNQLTALPEFLGRLTQLKELDVSDNQLTALPEFLGRLAQLQGLDVSRNQLTALPEILEKLTQLQTLHLHDNPKLGLPPEVLGLTWLEIYEGKVQPARPASILEYYFRSRASQPLNEAKMILVGRGGVGKTSLVQRLVHSTFDPNEKKTDGIAITPWQVEIGRDRVRLNIWDFGGQEIMHATHQFFLTKRSLYLLVLNAREGEQDANVEYWLRIIESFGGESPVIVVINKVKDHPFDLNRRGLQEKFPAIRDFVQTNCDAKLGLDALRRTIERETDRLEHLRDPFPASWFTIKDRLTNLKENFIIYEHYQKLCAADGLKEPTSRIRLWVSCMTWAL